MACRAQRAPGTTGRLAVVGRRRQRSHTLSGLSHRCLADACPERRRGDCGETWRRGVGHAPIPAATAIEALLTALLNEITTIPDDFVLVLDDYHLVDAKAVHQALAFLLDHLPPQMHLVITTREDPQLPLARYHARGQMTELRAVDLRFTPAEATGFLNQVMDLNLAAEDVTALEARTEGWIAGLQLAALSLRGARTLVSSSGRSPATTAILHTVTDCAFSKV